MPKGKRKVKKIGFMEKLLNKCGYVRAPKKRAGKVAVKPYNRKAPAKAADQNPPKDATAAMYEAMTRSAGTSAGHDTI